jgi:hypothetical protein
MGRIHELSDEQKKLLKLYSESIQQCANPGGTITPVLIDTGRQIEEKAPVRVPALNTYSASELYDMVFAPPTFAVEQLMPSGLAILAAAPKMGKSLFSLLLGCCVAEGKDFLGFPTNMGDVLYLDLESRDWRVKSRLEKIWLTRAPERLKITHNALCLDIGLLEQMKDWLNNAEQPRLIVVDTLGRVRGKQKRNGNAYQFDTDELAEIKRIADDYKITVLLVHHLNKKNNPGGDPYERISGTMGIAGAADQIYLLTGDRDSSEKALSASGRDIESMDLILRCENCLWQKVSDNAEAYTENVSFRRSPVIQGIIKIMDKRDVWVGTASGLLEAICSVLESTPANIRPSLIGRELAIHGRRLKAETGICVDRDRSSGTRNITITKRVRQTEVVS